MSKTVDDLMRIYSDAACASSTFPQYETPDRRAGITAVIRALRDEMTGVSRLRDVQRLFEEVLGDAGSEKVAGSTPEVAVVPCSAEGEPPASPATAPVLYSPSLKRLVSHTDPAPAVCEWTPDLFGRMQHWHPACNSRVLAAGPDDKGNCYICGRPIKFTEAK